MTQQDTAPGTTPPVRTRPTRMPPRKPSHLTRNITVGVIGIFVLLAAIGSASNRSSVATGPTAPADALPSQGEDPGGEVESASPTAGSASLLSIKGTGPTTSEEFHATGLSIDVAYSYTCPTEDSFTLNIYGTNESPLLPDVLASEFGTTGANITNEPLSGATGPFTLEVDSPCDWTIEVTGAP